MPDRAQVTIDSLQVTLKRHRDFLTADPYLELGSNSEVVSQLLSELHAAFDSFNEDLKSSYTIEQGVVLANAYFEVIAGLQQVIEFFTFIQVKGYGSPENTQQAVTLIETCLRLLGALKQQKIGTLQEGDEKSESPSPLSPKQPKKRKRHRPAKPLPPARLLRILTDSFNVEELKTLSFQLDVKYDDLPGESLTGKARELIQYLRRHGRGKELENALCKLRPHLFVDKTE